MAGESPPPAAPGDILLQTRVIDVEGIGPVYATKLNDAGVVTMADLRRADAAVMAAKTGISVALVQTWKSMSDLMRVPEIGNQYAELVFRAGYRNVEELAGASPGIVRERIEAYLKTVQRAPTREPYEAARVDAWIQQARALVAKKPDPRAASPPAPAAAAPQPASRAPGPAGGPALLAPIPAAPAATPAAPAPAPAKPAAPPSATRPRTATEDVQALIARYGSDLEHLDDTDPKIPTLLLKDGAKLLDLARHLQEERKFEHLALITTIDWKTHLEVVYNFWSYSRNVPLEVKVRLAPTEARLPSLTSLWAGADWHERENFDLMGVTFEGHPDLRRILLPDEWLGHPLRKNYEWKKEQYVGLDPVTGKDHVYQEPREGAW